MDREKLYATPAMWRVAWPALLLSAFALRIWKLDRLGMAYDEAASALMAQATPLEIVRFHWLAPFEHPPLWVLLIHIWSGMAGQSELALRLLPAYAGVLAVPLLARLTHTIWPGRMFLAWLSGALVAVSPVLVYYSQEARMYSLVVTLAALAALLSLRQAADPTWPRAGFLVVTLWAMLGLHYYSALVVGILALYFAAIWCTSPRHALPGAGALAAIYLLGTLPLLLWIALAPGFHETLAVVLREAERSAVNWQSFFTDFWREITFGAIRWIPEQAQLGWLLVPLVLAGIGLAASAPARTTESSSLRHAGWLLVMLAILPLLISSLFLRTISTRYILYVAPFLWTLMALTVWAAFRRSRWVGIAALILTLIPFGAGLSHYMQNYVKSDYRTMTETLRAGFQPSSDVILLEGPRQHLLAKAYLPRDWPIYPMPTVELPETWPINAPLLMPEDEDDRLQAFLETHRALWVIYAGENEVDPGEFLAKYLTAVAYRYNCDQWIDVRLCQYLSPQAIRPEMNTSQTYLFGQELLLDHAWATLYQPAGESASLLVQLDWRAAQKPSIDYKVSLRLLDPTGALVVQDDDFPIGTLLPPTTWSAGDRKPGYRVVPLPPMLAKGEYRVEVSVYDPVTGVPFPGIHPDRAGQAASPLVVALLHVDDTMQLISARTDAPESTTH